MTNDTVCVIVFAKDGTVHKVVSTRKEAMDYCGDNTIYNWECYAIQKVEPT